MTDQIGNRHHSAQLSSRLALLLLLCFFSLPAFAAPPTIDISPAFTPHLIRSGWQSLIVTLTNPVDGSAVNGEVQVTLSDPDNGMRMGVYTRPVSLPAGASRTHVAVTIALPHNTPDVTVFLVNGKEGNSEPVTRRTFARVPVDTAKPLLITVSGQPDTLQYLDQEPLGVTTEITTETGTLRIFRKAAQTSGKSSRLPAQPTNTPPPFVVTNLPTPQDLPENATAYDAVSIVYLGPDAVPDAFTDRQVGALRQWVHSGGCLVVGQGQSTDAKIRSDERFRSWIPPYSPSGNAPWLLRAIGMGHLVVLGVDPTTLASPQGLALWRQIASLSVAPISMARIMARADNYGTTLGTATLFAPGTEAPGIAVIGGFLLLYILLLVPVNYLVLKRLKHREWAWVTIPILVLLFSVAAYGFGYATKRKQLLVNTATLIEMGVGSGTTTVAGAVGLFSPTRARYRVAVDTPDSVFSTGYQRYMDDSESDRDIVIVEGDQRGEARNVDIPMWSMRSVTLQTHTLRLGDGIEAHLKLSGDPSAWRQITGTVTNHTGKTLTGVVVSRGEIGQRMGTLLPNQTVTVNIDRAHPDYVPNFGIKANRLYNPNHNKYTDDERRQQLQSALTSAITDSGYSRFIDPTNPHDTMQLTGWLDEPFLPVLVDGKAVKQGFHTNLVLVHL
jgi:uncharacterized membrane protein YhaH (DUF805 family)